MLILKVVLFIVSLILCGYYFVRRKYSYWKRKGVPFLEPTFPYGNVNGPNPKVHSTHKFDEHYKLMKNKSPYFGIYMFLKPVIFATDIDLIKSILVKDFQFFINRGAYFNEKDDPLSANLINIEDQQWKDLRAKLTPTFTSGKMKYMFPTIKQTADELKTCLENELKISSEIEIRDMSARFTTDVIGTCAFGIECNSLKDSNAEFRRMGKRSVETARRSRLKQLFLTTFPNLARRLGFTMVIKDVSEFFMETVRETVEFREKNNVKRNDFMEILIGLKKNNVITMEQLSAQVFLFFIAGFETSTTVISFALFELALNEDIQEIAREEVRQVLENYNGELSYEALLEMKYLDQLVNETLRKYPPAIVLVRQTTKDYFEPKLNILLEKKTSILIPTYSIHHDPEYYPDPEKFDPNRFTDEECQKRNVYTFLPFGEGPRNCIGLRFGMMQTKIGLATMLLNFKFSLSSKTQLPLRFKHQAIVLTPEGGLFLNVEKID